jgi:hypothetical protein
MKLVDYCPYCSGEIMRHDFHERLGIYHKEWCVDCGEIVAEDMDYTEKEREGWKRA